MNKPEINYEKISKDIKKYFPTFFEYINSCNLNKTLKLNSFEHPFFLKVVYCWLMVTEERKSFKNFVENFQNNLTQEEILKVPYYKFDEGYLYCYPETLDELTIRADNESSKSMDSLLDCLTELKLFDDFFEKFSLTLNLAFKAVDKKLNSENLTSYEACEYLFLKGCKDYIFFKAAEILQGIDNQ